MAIVKMSKFTLLSLTNERTRLLRHLQDFSDVHFLQNNEPPEGTIISDRSTEVQSINEEMARIRHLIDSLTPYVEGKRELASLSFDEVINKAKDFHFEELYEEITSLLKKRDGINNEIRALEQHIEILKPWKALDCPLSEIGNKKYTIRALGVYSEKDKTTLEKRMVEEGIHFEYLGEKDRVYHYFLLYLKENEEEVVELLRALSLTKTTLEGDSIPESEIENIRIQIADKESELQIVERDIKNHLPRLEELEVYYEYLANEKLKEEVSVVETKTSGLIEGFVPSEKAEDFKSMIDREFQGKYYLELEDANKDDPEVPIALNNSKLVKPFESLTTMYAMPKYNEIDPTPLLAPFYWFFFGMMAADLGYGILLTIGAFGALKFMKPNKAMAENLKFFGLLGIATIIWGVIYSSFFGGIIELPWAPILDSNNFNQLLVVSIIFGAIHIFFGLGIKAYMMIRDGDPLGAFFDVGLWYMALIGGAGFLIGGVQPELLSPNLTNIFKWIMIVGMVGIVLFGARDSKNPVARLVGGAYELYGISSYVGDFVSYSRLMALGLSGGFIAFAVNYICEMVGATGIIGILFAVVIFIIFHLFNMFLSFLSGYVHSARLTYVEFFGKFYEGGGIPFRKFRTEPEYIEYK